MSNSLVSIICPFYNRQDYLEECIQSLISQTYQNIEIILINDGSEDHSAEIADQFDDPRIRLFDWDHAGCWTTKNNGIMQSTGDFICFVDSDDKISPDYIKTAMQTIKKNPLYDYYYPTSLQIMEENGTVTNSVWRYIDYPLSRRANLIYLFYHNLIGGVPHAGALIRREVFAEKRYDSKLKNLADTVFIVQNALNIRFFMIKNPGIYYNRQHEGQTNKDNAARCRAFSDLIYFIWKHYPSAYYLPELNDPEDIALEVVTRLNELHSQNKKICNDYFRNARKILLWLRKRQNQ